MSKVQETNITNAAAGDPFSTKSKVLNTAASMTQQFEPIEGICGYLNSFHVYADDRKRFVESFHYCAMVNEDVRQCLIYDSNSKNARLIGVEYMITPKLYEQLPKEERVLWHSHIFEVKSGMLIMPKPHLVSDALWEEAETKELEDIIKLYGKIFHFWQIDRGDTLPLGGAKLMMSVAKEEDVPPGLWEKMTERDERFAVDYKRKKDVREGMEGFVPHPDADCGFEQKVKN